MHIPSRNLEKFVREVADQCMISQGDRSTRYEYFRNYYLYGGEDANNSSIYNKTFATVDDLVSLLFSPVHLRFLIDNPDVPNLLEQAKGRAASSKLRNMARQSDTDSRVSECVEWGLVKGKTFLKQTWKRSFSPEVIQPDVFGVLRENHDKLDQDMEAFTHSMLITPYQFERLIFNHPDKEALRKKAKKYASESRLARGGTMQVTTGGLYPFQPAGSTTPTVTRGLVDWMSAPSPMVSPRLEGQLLQLDEVWIWDDKRNDWATFQIVGDDILIMGKYRIFNALNHDPVSMRPFEDLIGHHPFVEFCPNPVDGYFWGRSEIINIALLQEAINSRINGINKLLRKQEEPPKRFIGSSGVNQVALSRFNKPGGYWTDSNPNAKVDEMIPTIPSDLWASLHEYERMFDEMCGLPPIMKGRGEAGVRSAGHASNLLRMASPRFKDRALLVERSVEGLGGLMLNLAKAHEPTRLTAWVDKQAAGLEAAKENPLILSPAPGQAAVNFTFADLDDAMTLRVDAHSSSPAFADEAKADLYDRFKTGAVDAKGIIDHSDVTDPESAIASVERKEIAEAQAHEQELKAKQNRSHH